MKQVLFLFIGVLLLSSLKQKDRYAIEVEILGCGSGRKYSDWVYLVKEDKKVDSINSYTYKDFVLFQSWVRKAKFRFRGLIPGEYQIKYTPRYNFDSIATVQVVSSDVKHRICFDEIPANAYQQPTLLDKLSSGDTLYINGYIAAGGEFGGYDEGLWMWKEGIQLKGQFFALANSYGIGWDTNRQEFYRQHINQAQAVSQAFVLTENQNQDVKRFLVETGNYRKRNTISNAPEFITVYNKNGGYQIMEHDFDWRPFLSLKKKITTANGEYQ